MNYLEIVSTPGIVALSGSPLLFAVSSSRQEEFYKIIANPFPGDPAAGNDLLPLNSNNQAIFDLHEYFEGTRKSEFTQDGVHIHENHCKPAEIQFQEYFGNPPEALNGISHNMHIQAGSIPRWKQYYFRSLYSNYHDYLLTAKPYLTWYPRAPYKATFKKVLPDQPERLYFLNILPAQVLHIVVGVFLDDETFFLMDPGRSSMVEQYQVVSFATGFNQLGLPAWLADNHPGRKITHYYVSVAKENGFAVSEAYTYKVDYKIYRNLRYLIFQNSLCGYDILPCTGEYDEISEVERTTADRVPDVSDPNRLHKVEYKREFSSFVKVNTGWLNLAEKEWLNDLFISNEIYELKDGQMIRILMKSKQLDTTDRPLNPGDVELEYERLFLAE